MSKVPYVALRDQVNKATIPGLLAQYGSGMHKTQPDCDNCEYATSTMLCEMTSNAGRCPLIVVELPN